MVISYPLLFQYAVFFHVQVGTKQRKIIFCGELDIFFGAGRKVQPVTQLYHQRVGVGSRLDADAVANASRYASAMIP